MGFPAPSHLLLVTCSPALLRSHRSFSPDLQLLTLPHSSKECFSNFKFLDILLRLLYYRVATLCLPKSLLLIETTSSSLFFLSSSPSSLLAHFSDEDFESSPCRFVLESQSPTSTTCTDKSSKVLNTKFAIACSRRFVRGRS